MIRGNGLQKSDFRDSGFPCIHYGQIHTHYGTSTSVTKSSVKELLIEFAQSETELVSKHLIEMQKTNGALTDRVNELTDTLSTVCQERQDVVDEYETENKRLIDELKNAMNNNIKWGAELADAKKIIIDLSKYVSDSKWYVQNGYVELQKELVAKAETFLKE